MTYVEAMGVLLLVIAVTSIVGRDDLAAERAASREYCGNVATWKATHGQYGHPAYRGQQECEVGAIE